MDWLSSSALSILSILIPTFVIVGIFAFALRKAHERHLTRIEKIKQGYLFSDED